MAKIKRITLFLSVIFMVICLGWGISSVGPKNAFAEEGTTEGQTVAASSVKIEKPTTLTFTQTYTGSVQTVPVAQYNGIVIRGLEDAVNVGHYTLYYSLVDGYTWADGTTDDIAFTLDITKALVEKPEKDTTAFVYTGEAITYHLQPSDLYTVSGATQTDAGDHVVTITLNSPENYAWAGGDSDPLFYPFNIAEEGTYLWLVIVLACVLLVEVMLVALYWQHRIPKHRKVAHSVFLPLLLAVMLRWQLVAIGLLSVAIVGVAVCHIALLERQRKDKEMTFTTDRPAYMTAGNTVSYAPSSQNYMPYPATPAHYQPQEPKKDQTESHSDDSVKEVGTISETSAVRKTKENNAKEKGDMRILTKNKSEKNTKQTVTKTRNASKIEEGKSDDDRFANLNDEDIEEIRSVDKQTGKTVVKRYNVSFTAKLIQSTDETKSFYAQLKNAILSYDKTKSTVWWNSESIHIANKTIVKFAIHDGVLCLYLALHPEDYNDSRYQVEAAEGKRYSHVPCLYRIKNARRAKLAADLFTDLATRYGLQTGMIHNDSYYLPAESTEQLIEKGLIKELGSYDDEQTKS